MSGNVYSLSVVIVEGLVGTIGINKVTIDIEKMFLKVTVVTLASCLVPANTLSFKLIG